MMYKRGPSQQLKSLKHQSHLSTRQRIIVIILVAALALILLYSAWLMRKGKPKNTTSPLAKVGRGAIYDRYGRVLAAQVESYTISLWLPDVRGLSTSETLEQRNERIDTLTKALAPIVLWPQRDLYERILNHSSNTLVLLRRADIQIKNRLELLKESQRLPGLRIDAEFSRSYPQGQLAAPLLGYLNLDARGGEGLEYAFDRFLSPPAVAEDQETIYGYSLELTLDINLQASIENIVQRGLTNTGAEAAVAIVMDAHNGDILSYVSLPSYNPTFYHQYNVDHRINRPVVEAYEPGSVFKVFTMAAMLEAKVIDPGETFCCPGHYEQTINGQTFRINCTAEHGDQTVADIMANSCNAGMAYFSERMGNTAFHDAIASFGFGRRTNVPLSGETTGLLAKSENWSARTKPTLAMGQEIGVSSMQIMQAATVFANQGWMIKPRIVKHLLAADGSIYQSYPREEVAKVLSRTTVDNILGQMQHSVEKGIARRLQMSELSVGGKTGTSQTIDTTTGSYSSDNYIASTLAFVPALDPRYIVYVVMHHPRSSIWGSNVAAPLTREMVELLIPHVGLNTSRTDFIQLTSAPKITKPHYPDPTIQLPNFEQESLRQALHFFGSEDLFYLIDGTGFWVSEQFPPAGSVVRPEMTVRLKSEDQ